MNPIKAIIEDFRTDWIFLKKAYNGKYKFPYTLKEVLDIRPMLKDAKTWIFFMIIIAAVFTGMFISAKHYQRIANEEIIKAQEFIDMSCIKMGITIDYSNSSTPNFTKLLEETRIIPYPHSP